MHTKKDLRMENQTSKSPVRKLYCEGRWRESGVSQLLSNESSSGCAEVSARFVTLVPVVKCFYII